MFLSITWTTSDGHQALIFNHAPATPVVIRRLSALVCVAAAGITSGFRQQSREHVCQLIHL